MVPPSLYAPRRFDRSDTTKNFTIIQHLQGSGTVFGAKTRENLSIYNRPKPLYSESRMFSKSLKYAGAGMTCRQGSPAPFESPLHASCESSRPEAVFNGPVHPPLRERHGDSDLPHGLAQPVQSLNPCVARAAFSGLPPPGCTIREKDKASLSGGTFPRHVGFNNGIPSFRHRRNHCIADFLAAVKSYRPGSAFHSQSPEFIRSWRTDTSVTGIIKIGETAHGESQILL